MTRDQRNSLSFEHSLIYRSLRNLVVSGVLFSIIFFAGGAYYMLKQVADELRDLKKEVKGENANHAIIHQSQDTAIIAHRALIYGNYFVRRK
jgi:hypothetical protein